MKNKETTKKLEFNKKDIQDTIEVVEFVNQLYFFEKLFLIFCTKLILRKAKKDLNKIS